MPTRREWGLSAATLLATLGIACQTDPPTQTAARTTEAPTPRACADFLSRTDFDVTVMDAELMRPGTDTEYCWVDAMVRPNIRFAVSLPTDWNGRFVMRGGGGYAGQLPRGSPSPPIVV